MTTKSKKTVKKSAKKITLIRTSRTPFDKKNAIEFSKQLYNEANNKISYMKLACETLKDEGLHCVIGEAYCQFVSPKLANVFTLSNSIINNRVDSDMEWYHTHNPHDLSSGDPATILAINKLVEVAVVKNKNITKKQLAKALESVVDQNDSDHGSDDDVEFLERASSVAYEWDKKVVPLLK
jgi:hypothetical protein